MLEVAWQEAGRGDTHIKDVCWRSPGRKRGEATQVAEMNIMRLL